MNKKRIITAFILFVCCLFSVLSATDSRDLKLRFFKGDREGKAEPPVAVTSSYLQSTVTANIQSRFELSDEVDQIKKVFNLKSVELLTESDLRWNAHQEEKKVHILRLNGAEYLVQLTPQRDRVFRLEVFEQREKKKTNLLDTELFLPKKNIAVFGFEDNKGIPYFISFHEPVRVLSGVQGGVAGGVVGGTKDGVQGGVQGDVLGEVAQMQEKPPKDAVRAEGEMRPPRLIKRIDPVYPEEARRARVEGVVILEAATDKTGKVVYTKVKQGKDEYLNQAALNTVKQWVYEPYLKDGKPIGVIFTCTIRFKLKRDALSFAEKDKNVIGIGSDEKPQLVKRVDPVYPREARQSGISGAVILEVLVDEEGNVADIEVIRSESSMLNDAAVAAIKQWQYAPYIKNGKPVRISFTVTVVFRLR